MQTVAHAYIVVYVYVHVHTLLRVIAVIGIIVDSGRMHASVACSCSNYFCQSAWKRTKSALGGSIEKAATVNIGDESRLADATISRLIFFSRG